jgi:hypothetical protein
MTDYNDHYVRQRLGGGTTVESSRVFMQRARDWYNTTPKDDMVAWYDSRRGDADPEIKDPFSENRLVNDWKDIMIARRAIAIGRGDA